MASLVIWCIAYGTYLAFAGNISISECITGLAVAGLMTVWATVIRRSSPDRFEASWQLVRHVLRAIAAVPPAAVRTGLAFFRNVVAGASPGRAHRDPFRFGGDNAIDRSRRAIAVLCASLAPDRFVVSVRRDDEVALTHYVVRRDHDPDPRWLE
jgi:hypothetical protein